MSRSYIYTDIMARPDTAPTWLDQARADFSFYSFLILWVISVQSWMGILAGWAFCIHWQYSSVEHLQCRAETYNGTSQCMHIYYVLGIVKYSYYLSEQSEEVCKVEITQPS